eukprot:m.337157 g.337157  ORF g.337157 m.337157 type:complete len:603 (-) comp18063_c0_seq1:62-1870(-)
MARNWLRTALVLSPLATAGVVYHALTLKKQFYPAVVYITNSNISMMIIHFQMCVLFVLLAKLFQRIFFGKLRDIEVEHLYDRSWFAVSETCLAMTIFRDEFTAQIVVLFGLLLAMKMFHWLCMDRVEFMEQTPRLTKLFHVRMVTVSIALFCVDVFLVNVATQSILQSGPSMQLLFGFEYMVLATVMVTTFVKYIINVIESFDEDPWDNKTLYMFYIDLLSDFLKLIVYISFFLVLMNFYGLPLHIIRDLCATFRSFLKRCNDLIQSRRATHSLERFPDVTPEELSQVDNVCVICREEMTTQAKRLPCGHVIHLRCLRSWMPRAQICPICRADILTLDANQAPAQPAQQQPPPQQQQQAEAQPQPQPPQQQQRTEPPQPQPQPNQHHQPQPQPQPHQHQHPHTHTHTHQSTPAPAPTPAPPTLPPQFPPPPTSFMAPPPPFPSMQGVGGLTTPYTPNGGPFGAQFGGLFGGPPSAFIRPPPGFIPFNFAAQGPVVPMQCLSDTELRALEGDEREKVLARIAFLRRFRSEMDGMLARFGQYEELSGRANGTTDANEASAADEDPTPPGATPSPSSQAILRQRRMNVLTRKASSSSATETPDDK